MAHQGALFPDYQGTIRHIRTCLLLVIAAYPGISRRAVSLLLRHIMAHQGIPFPQTQGTWMHDTGVVRLLDGQMISGTNFEVLGGKASRKKYKVNEEALGVLSNQSHCSWDCCGD
eukprot:1142626-Pelagomonas_calceolata.AAC.3